MVRTSKTTRFGFTIVELMAVVSLIALLIGVSVPLIFKIDELSRDRTGVNSFSVAVTAARAYATRRLADSLDPAQSEYSGAAVVVTPMNELRIVEDIQEGALEAQQKSAYRDIPRIDPIAMPRGVGIVGIGRSGGTFVLLPPPFAIRFNKFGQMVTEVNPGASAEAVRNIVYYDGGTTRRSSSPADTFPNFTYSPSSTTNTALNYDPDIATIEKQWNSGALKYNLPFGALETVVGVITYSKADFEDSGGAWPATPPSLGCLDGSCAAGLAGIHEWMFDNGNVIFFSRNTGNILRINRP